jgi:uncharacterized protein with von Willebrand factor type A (vWA) domain
MTGFAEDCAEAVAAARTMKAENRKVKLKIRRTPLRFV